MVATALAWEAPADSEIAVLPDVESFASQAKHCFHAMGTAPPSRRQAASQRELPPPPVIPCALSTSGTDTTPSLLQSCIGFIGQHITAFVEQLERDYLACLPPESKAALLLVARERGELSDDVLGALADDSWTVLDLGGCAHLSDSAIQTTLAGMRQLRALNLYGCSSVSRATLKMLAVSCPDLSLLRIGGAEALDNAFSSLLPHLLPDLSQEAPDKVADSWEEVCPSDFYGLSGRLCNLRWLVWPSIPQSSRSKLLHNWPKICLNPVAVPLPHPASHATSAHTCTAHVRPTGADVAAVQPAPEGGLGREGSVSSEGGGSAQSSAGANRRCIEEWVQQCRLWNPFDINTPLDGALLSYVGSAAWEHMGPYSDDLGHAPPDPLSDEAKSRDRRERMEEWRKQWLKTGHQSRGGGQEKQRAVSKHRKLQGKSVEHLLGVLLDAE